MPILDRPWMLGAAALYLAAVLGVALWSARRTRDARDFFIAGQRLGLWVTAFAAMSSAFSGFVFLGGPGLTYRLGFASLFIMLPVGFTAGLLCWAVGGRLRQLAEGRGVLTLPDALAARFPGRLVRGWGALAILVGSIGYLAAQLLALGILVEALFGWSAALGPWSLPAATAAGLAVVLFYSVAGGMVAGAYTDLLQGGLMLGAAVAVFARALAVGGGWQRMVAVLSSPEPFAGFLEPFGRAPAHTAIGFFFVFGVGVLGQPQMLHKFFMLRDPRRLRWMPAVLGGSQAVCLLVWLGIGLAVPALVAGGALAPLADPDQAAPLFVLRFLPAMLGGLVVAAILAAVMSTADAFLNIGAAALVRDLPALAGRRPADRLAWGRAATVAIALAAALLALVYGDLVALLGTFAFGTFAAALAPALAIGLNWRRVTRLAAAASIATGLALNLGLELQARIAGPPGLLAPGVLPSSVALAGSLTVLMTLSWLGSDTAGDRGRLAAAGGPR